MNSNDLPKVLLVDDNVNMLQAFVRQMHEKYDIAIADDGDRALELIKEEGPFEVIISDMRMPGMNGIQFLTQVQTLNPDGVRIMLTGNADVDTAMHAVNEGNVFRFLVKPCRKDILEWAIEAALKQYRLVTAERELLQKTLKGSVQILTDVLSLVNPTAFGRASRLKDYVSQITHNLGIKNAWQFELAALLSQVGCVAIPKDILAKVYSGLQLDEDEKQIFDSYPDIGQNLLSRIPRLEEVRDMIAFQQMSLRQIGRPQDEVAKDVTYFGAQLLRTCTDFDTLICSGKTRTKALTVLKCKPEKYLAILLRALDDVKTIGAGEEVRAVSIKNLSDSMVLAQDVKTRAGILIAPTGQKVTLSMRALLRNYLRQNAIEKEVLVLQLTDPGDENRDAEFAPAGSRAEVQTV